MCMIWFKLSYKCNINEADIDWEGDNIVQLWSDLQLAPHFYPLSFRAK